MVSMWKSWNFIENSIVNEFRHTQHKFNKKIHRQSFRKRQLCCWRQWRWCPDTQTHHFSLVQGLIMDSYVKEIIVLMHWSHWCRSFLNIFHKFPSFIHLWYISGKRWVKDGIRLSIIHLEHIHDTSRRIIFHLFPSLIHLILSQILVKDVT